MCLPVCIRVRILMRWHLCGHSSCIRTLRRTQHVLFYLCVHCSLRISKRMRASLRAGMLPRMHACIRRLIRTHARIFLACACCFRSFIRIFCLRMRARMWKVLKARYVSRDARLAILACEAARLHARPAAWSGLQARFVQGRVSVCLACLWWACELGVYATRAPRGGEASSLSLSRGGVKSCMLRAIQMLCEFLYAAVVSTHWP